MIGWKGECVNGGVLVRKIALVGLMGVGKSSVGRALSQVFRCSFVDLDNDIEAFANKSIPQIFREDGETAFRTLEHQRLQTLSEVRGDVEMVLATGGGVVESPENRSLLQNEWYTIWLDADVETLAERIQRDSSVRPLLQAYQDLALRQRLRDLYSRRELWYKHVARVRVQVVDLTVDEVVQHLLRLGI